MRGRLRTTMCVMNPKRTQLFLVALIIRQLRHVCTVISRMDKTYGKRMEEKGGQQIKEVCVILPVEYSTGLLQQ
jgi:hypothetical protein